MGLLHDVGGISAVRSTLTTAKVPSGVIDQVIAIVEFSSDGLDEGRGKFREPEGSIFGGTHSAQVLGTHTAKAHQKLSNSVLEAVASLQATGAAMKQFDQEMSQADGDAHDATRALLVRTQAAVDTLDDNRHTPPVVPVDESGSDH